nr:hypothetical protein [uncultured archaeon]
MAVARFRANSDRANLNCNRTPGNSNAELGITQVFLGLKMKTYKNLYLSLCSQENLEKAFKKARKRKTNKSCVIEFEKNLKAELANLKQELELLSYKPKPLKEFAIRDPKTRKIHKSAFRDRVVHHALVNILDPIYEKIFICDSYASRINKGTINALLRFDKFKRIVSSNGKLINEPYSNNSVKGYVLKADVKHYFEAVDHEILLKIVNKKIKDEKVIWLINQIISNFDSKTNGKGMPLGNLTSQFFANVYLNELDYFVKHKLKAKYYIRYVDDFVILDNQSLILRNYKKEITNFLKDELKLELHPDKSKIIPLKKGIAFLGYRIFYHYKLLRKANLVNFNNHLASLLSDYESDYTTYSQIYDSLQGWLAYASHANTFNQRRSVLNSFLTNLFQKPLNITINI